MGQNNFTNYKKRKIGFQEINLNCYLNYRNKVHQYKNNMPI